LIAMARLDGRVALITGAGAGIGLACAERFVAEGASVLMAEINAETGQANEARINAKYPARVKFVATDVKSETSLGAAFDACEKLFGQVDMLVNCAGGSIAEDASVVDVDMSVWDHTIDLDLKGAFLSCRVGIPFLQAAGGGAIVNFTSVVALKGAFQGHVYTAAKGGIISLTQALAGKYARDGIRVNAIAPGIVLSERVGDRLGIEADATREEKIAAAQQMKGRLVESRHRFGFGLPEDIANIALFLVSEESRMVNGAVIPAEGGAARY